jgi:hypothetical protein
MFNARICTTDKLLELVYWFHDRAAYRRACGIVNGSAYAEDCAAETLALAELERRGVLPNYRAWCAQVDAERARDTIGEEVPLF